MLGGGLLRRLPFGAMLHTHTHTHKDTQLGSVACFPDTAYDGWWGPSGCSPWPKEAAPMCI